MLNTFYMAKLKYPRISQKKTIKEVKERPSLKRNITFRVREDLIERFSKICDSHDVQKVDVIENLIERFLELNRK